MPRIPAIAAAVTIVTLAGCVMLVALTGCAHVQPQPQPTAQAQRTEMEAFILGTRYGSAITARTFMQKAPMTTDRMSILAWMMYQQDKQRLPLPRPARKVKRPVPAKPETPAAPLPKAATK